jgi:hypothetical protein
MADVRRWVRKGYRLGMTLEGPVAIDLDPQEAYMGLAVEFVDLPGTSMQRTPRGGMHYLYRTTAENSADARQRIGWRTYLKGQVDIKAGPGSFIVLYPSEHWQWPMPELFNELPEAIAGVLGESRAQPSALFSSAAWAEMAERTRNYRVSDRVLAKLHDDRRKLPGAMPGRQSAELNRMAFVWGKSVAKGFVGAETVEGVLLWGAAEMVNQAGRDHGRGGSCWT